MLKGMGLTEEQIDSVIESHSETVDALKEQINALKEETGSLPEIKKSLAKAQADLEDSKKDNWKTKYDMLKEEYENFKSEQKKKETREAKETAYTELLKEAGISEKHIAAVLKVSDVDGIELDAEGNPKDADNLVKSIKDEWSDFIQTTSTKGADTAKPPANNGGSQTLTKDEIVKMKDPVKRQEAIANNIELFQKG